MAGTSICRSHTGCSEVAPQAWAGIATVRDVSAIEEVLTAFAERGWRESSKVRVSGGRSPNPTRVDLAFGKQQLSLVMYAWKVTGEGKGRSGDNFRIQTTRSHEGELLSDGDRLTLGFGVDSGRGVLVVFDGWTKRNTGSSSSVHIKRALLDAAAESGFSTDGPVWDARAACRMSNIESLLPWIDEQMKPRLAAVQALAYEVKGERATATADLWDSAPAAWLRVGDRLVLADRDGERLVDDSIWTVKDVAVTLVGEGRYPRRNITFTLKRYGRVKNAAKMLEGLTRRPAS